MDLFIANCSNQDHDFVFWLPEGRRHHMRPIRAGGQIRLKDIAPEAAKAIIEHHEIYGMRDIAKIKNEKGFHGLCYSENEIKTAGIQNAIAYNMKELAEEGERLRDTAAVAADQALLSSAPSTSELKATVVEMKELETAGKPNTEINEERTVKATPDKPEDRRGRKSGPR